jgi:hypothetical protein
MLSQCKEVADRSDISTAISTHYNNYLWIKRRSVYVSSLSILIFCYFLYGQDFQGRICIATWCCSEYYMKMLILHYHCLPAWEWLWKLVQDFLDNMFLCTWMCLVLFNRNFYTCSTGIPRTGYKNTHIWLCQHV